MKKIIILMMLIGTYASAQELRNDVVKDQLIESFGWHKNHENNFYVVNIKYLNLTYSRHEFKTKKERKAFTKSISILQVGLKQVLKARAKRRAQGYYN